MILYILLFYIIITSFLTLFSLMLENDIVYIFKQSFYKIYSKRFLKNLYKSPYKEIENIIYWKNISIDDLIIIRNQKYELYKQTGKSNYSIDLSKYCNSNKVLVGSEYGLKVRKILELDNIEDKFKIITFCLSSDIRSINPSFLEALLKPSINKLGFDQYCSKYSWINHGNYRIEKDLNEVYERIRRFNSFHKV